MTGYLARLALRSLGRPVEARLAPRIDTATESARGATRADPTDLELETETLLLARREHDAPEPAPAPKPAAASVGRLPTAEAASAHSRNAPVAEPSAPGARPRSPLTPAEVETAARTPRVVHGADGSISSLRRALPDDETSIAPAQSHALAPRDTQADRATRSVRPNRKRADAPAMRRDGKARERETPAAGDNDAAFASTHAMHEQRARIDPSAIPRSLQQPEAPDGSAAPAETASVSVEIGRIEVRLASPPSVPAARPRPAPEGFEGYRRLRNYLDRSR